MCHSLHRPHVQATHGCGDLIFSSHTTFVLTGVLTFTEYGETLIIKVWPGWLAWRPVHCWGAGMLSGWRRDSALVVDEGQPSLHSARPRLMQSCTPSRPAVTCVLCCAVPAPSALQVITWIAVSIMGLCIIASRKASGGCRGTAGVWGRRYPLQVELPAAPQPIRQLRMFG